MDGGWRIRAAVLVLAAGLGLHELRYAAARAAGEADASAAHAYLGWLAPLAGAALFLALVHFAAQLGTGGVAGGAAGGAAVPRLRALWPAASVALLAAFAVQEAAEALVASHAYGAEAAHPGLAGLLTESLWLVPLLAAALGGLVAVLLRGAARALATASRRRRRPVRRRPRHGRVPASAVAPPAAAELARNLAGRGPPVPSV